MKGIRLLPAMLMLLLIGAFCAISLHDFLTSYREMGMKRADSPFQVQDSMRVG